MVLKRVIRQLLRPAIVVALVSVPAFLVSNTASAELNCDALDGEWTGEMRGLLNGKTTVEINNCKLNWRLPDGSFNRCRYKENQGKTEYSCSRGSRGVVEIRGSKIKMQNIYTAVRHGGYTVNLSKVK